MPSPNKSCDLDPLPTKLFKAFPDTFTGFYPITNIVNPDDFKQAQINTLLNFD